MRKLLLLLFAALMLELNCSNAQNNKVIETELQDLLDSKDNGLIRVNIIFKSQIDGEMLNKANAKTKDERRAFVVEELKSFAKASQQDVMSILRAEEKSGVVSKIRTHWLVNAISCELERDMIYQLSSHPDIALIGYDKDEFLLWDENADRIDNTEIRQHITHVNADDVWNLGYTGKGVLVAIIDTGVNIDHVDLVNNLWDGGPDFPNHGYNTYEDNHNVNDGFGHGTHCAGIICGDGTSGVQTGIAPDATIMVVKVMDDGGYGGASSITAGMEFALEHGAELLNMSLGIPNASTSAKEMLRNACVNTMNVGVAAAVAVGNEGQLQISFPVPNNVRVPGACPPPWIHPDQEDNIGETSCCIAVGAVDFNNEHAPFSSYGPVTWQNTSFGDYPYEPGIGLIRPDICAPGVGILSADPFNSNGHTTMDGTSQAAPSVAGVICLMLEKDPELLPEDICRILETTTQKLSDNKNNYTGSGLVDALSAIENIEGGDVFPCDAPDAIETTTIDEYSISLSWNASANAISYDIYRDDSFVKNVTTTSYLDEGLSPATEYCYTIVTKCENGTSGHSDEACAITDELVMPCETPINLEALVEESLPDFDYTFKVTLSWDVVENAAAYLVYVNGELSEETDAASFVYGTDNEELVEFAVKTKCDNGESDLSEPLMVDIKHDDTAEHINIFELYPNPVRDELIINTAETINQIEIYNIIGVMIYCEKEVTANKIKMTELESGVYLIKIKTDKGDVVKQIVKTI